MAFFIPGIVHLADAIGTPSEAIAVRGFAVHLSLRISFAVVHLMGV